MKIVYVVTRSDAVGGASIHVRDMARWMLDHGHRAAVLVGGEGPFTDLLRAAAIPHRSLRRLQRSIHPFQDCLAYHELRQAIQDLHPDLVSLHTAKAGWIGRLVSHRLGIPAVYTPHGWAVGDRLSPAQGRIYTWAERAAAPWSAAIVCVSRHERQLALNKGIAPGSKLHVIYNGVRDVGPELRARPECRDRVRFVSVARFEAPKDHATLLRAFAGLGSFRQPPCELVLVGDGPGESAARRLVSELGVTEWVRFAGYGVSPAETLAGASGFVLSSRFEGFPRSVLEAMRAGLPVIASNVGGVSEVIAAEQNGLLVPPGDVAALTLALERLKRDSAERARMGETGRQTYEAKFRLDRMADETMGLYTAVLGIA